jgi:hypothetical protein
MHQFPCSTFPVQWGLWWRISRLAQMWGSHYPGSSSPKGSWSNTDPRTEKRERGRVENYWVCKEKTKFPSSPCRGGFQKDSVGNPGKKKPPNEGTWARKAALCGCGRQGQSSLQFQRGTSVHGLSLRSGRGRAAFLWGLPGKALLMHMLRSQTCHTQTTVL